MDHDFVCLSKQLDEEYDAEFSRGLEYYLAGEWNLARHAFAQCEDKINTEQVQFKHDGPLKRFLGMIDKAKMYPPDDWVHGGTNAYDWDKKPVPPEVDFAYMNEEGEETEENIE